MLQLVREIPLRTVIKTSLYRRGFLFYVAAGFSKDLDPESGMTVNLVQVDEWLNNLKQIAEAGEADSSLDNPQEFFMDLMQKAKQILGQHAEMAGSQLNSLCFREERGWSFSWVRSAEANMYFTYPFFIEAFSENGDFELLKVKLKWQYRGDKEIDFFSEGLKLLKPVSKMQDLIKFSFPTDHPQELTPTLDSFEVINLTKNYGLIISPHQT